MAEFKLFGADTVVSFTCYDQSDDHHVQRMPTVTVDDEKLLKPPNVVSDSGSQPRFHNNPIPQQFLPPKKRERNNRKESRGPLIPPQLLQEIETTEPVFLYQKKLEESDVKKIQNRLFLIKRQEFEKLLNDGEKAIVNDPTTKGLANIAALDSQGRLHKLGLNLWPSLNVWVINSGWYKLVRENNAQKGDLVQIWGYREMGQLRFAINFKKSVLRLGV